MIVPPFNETVGVLAGGGGGGVTTGGGGGGGVSIETVAEAVSLPPGPWHTTEYVVCVATRTD
jgi:hypothetical protein